MKELTDANFAEEIQNSVPIIVDFWAPWCGPCQRLGPIFEKVSSEYEGKLRFAKCNVDENMGAAQPYGVSSIPTLIVFKDGKEVGRFQGASNDEGLKESINKILDQL